MTNVILICRQVSHSLTPGSVRGFYCKCGREIQLSPEGQRQLAEFGRENVDLLCNPCGLALAEQLTKEPPEDVGVEVYVNPAAQDSMRRQGIDPLDFVRPPKEPKP